MNLSAINKQIYQCKVFDKFYLTGEYINFAW